MLPGSGILRMWFLIFPTTCHFARATVKLQGQHFIAVDQLHRRGFPALDGAFRLFRTKIKRKPQAVFG